MSRDQHRSMIILYSSALRISSLVSAKIGDKEESDLRVKRALLVRKNCEPIAIYAGMAPRVRDWGGGGKSKFDQLESVDVEV